MKRVFQWLLVLAILAPLASTRPGLAQNTSVNITINPSLAYQKINGWNAVAQIGQYECPGVETYRSEVFNRSVFEMGITRLQLTIPSGMENPVDYFAQYLQGQAPISTYQQHRYEVVNDNNDPFSINSAGFQFSFLDYTIDEVVLPIKQRLNARGEELYLVLAYVDFNKGNVDQGAAPEEYAELMLAINDHMLAKYGWAADGIEVIVEPDNAGWSPNTVANALVAAGSRLEEHGYTLDFLAPSTLSMKKASVYFDQMINNPEVLKYLKEITYHRYAEVSPEHLSAIADRARTYNLRTAMTEHIGSSYEDLHEDLSLGMNSAWSQFTLAFCSRNDDGGHHYRIDTHNPDRPSVSIGSRSKFLQQYFKYIRPGATRVEASSSDANYAPLAFFNPNGDTVVVIKAQQAGSFSVQGLEAGVYGVAFTTNNRYAVRAPYVTLKPGENLSASIPDKGVLTVFVRPKPRAVVLPRP